MSLKRLLVDENTEMEELRKLKEENEQLKRELEAMDQEIKAKEENEQLKKKLKAMDQELKAKDEELKAKDEILKAKDREIEYLKKQLMLAAATSARDKANLKGIDTDYVSVNRYGDEYKTAQK